MKLLLLLILQIATNVPDGWYAIRPFSGVLVAKADAIVRYEGDGQAYLLHKGECLEIVSTSRVGILIAEQSTEQKFAMETSHHVFSTLTVPAGKAPAVSGAVPFPVTCKPFSEIEKKHAPNPPANTK